MGAAIENGHLEAEEAAIVIPLDEVAMHLQLIVYLLLSVCLLTIASAATKPNSLPSQPLTMSCIAKVRT